MKDYIDNKKFEHFLVEKFELLGQVTHVKNETHARRSRIAENIAAVAESVEENSVHRILHKYLGLKAYKVQ